MLNAATTTNAGLTQEPNEHDKTMRTANDAGHDHVMQATSASMTSMLAVELDIHSTIQVQ